MKIAVIGTGYVGLVSGTCFAELGHFVTCIDRDKAKIASLLKGIIPIYEPDLDNLVAENVRCKRLQFTTELKAPLKEADAVFLAVGTPTNPKDGSADLRYIFDAAEQIAPLMKSDAVVVTKSTVPVGTAQRLQAAIQKKRGKKDIHIASNPEFLREGCAVNDFMQPDRIIIGTTTAKAEEVLRKLYLPLTGRGVPLIATDTQTSELTKYAANAFLATKIAFINEMADLCERNNADVETLAVGMGLDPRIGRTFLKTGPGFGGSCFPKDTLALHYTAKQSKVGNLIVPAVIRSNEQRKANMAEYIIRSLGGSVKGKTLAILGLTFKANTDDMRDSASLVIVPALLKAGAKLQLFDPQGMEQAKLTISKHKNITWGASAEQALAKADAAVILTEWNIFSTLDWQKAKAKMAQPVIVDLRNLFAPEQMAAQGFSYFSVGRPARLASPAAMKATLRPTKAAKRR